MNRELQKLNYKQINVFPLRCTLIPSYITLDTAALLEMLYDKNTNVLRNNLCDNKDLIWNTWFKLKNKCFKMSKSSIYKFDYTIITDGVGVSVRFGDNHDIYKKSKKNKKQYKEVNKTAGENKKTKKNREFKYMNYLKKKQKN